MILVPRYLEIGKNSIQKTSQLLTRLSSKPLKPLIITDNFLAKSGALQRLQSNLQDIPHGVWKDTVPDPTIDSVMSALDAYKSGNYNSLIALGGGSPIDTAKAVGILANNPPPISLYKFPNMPSNPSPPLIAIPTTAGTGSECTKFTIITDTSSDVDEKMLITGPSVLPTAAIVDYTLTLSCPLRLTADTGIDSMVHALEAYVSQKRNPFADQQALSALNLISKSIIPACYGDESSPPSLDSPLQSLIDPTDSRSEREIAREQMMLGATLAGMAFSNASVALVHALSRPIGAFFHIAHGLSNAQLLTTVTKFSIPALPHRYARASLVMSSITGTTLQDSEQVACEKLISGLEQLNQHLQVPSLKAYGVDKTKYDSVMKIMAQQAIASGSVNNNPRIATLEECIEIYKEAYDPVKIPVPIHVRQSYSRAS